LRLLAEGEVETQAIAGVVRGAVEPFPPSLFLRETAFTRVDEAVLASRVQKLDKFLILARSGYSSPHRTVRKRKGKVESDG